MPSCSIQVHLFGGDEGRELNKQTNVLETKLDRFHLHTFGHGSYDVYVHDNPNGVEVRMEGSIHRDDYLLRLGKVYKTNDPGADEDTMSNNVETVHYEDSQIDKLRFFARDGDDHIMVDCTGQVAIEIRGGNGDDVFVFGQVYNSKRDGEALLTLAEQSEVRVMRTDLGYLSTGNLYKLSAHGMDGDDKFFVQSNDGELQLTGDGGNDYFSVRSFSLADETEDRVREANATNRTTVIAGDLGDDFVQYDKNAAVNIDGGSGFNTLVIIGTPRPDTFVIEGLAVYGAGRYTTAINIQRFVVATQEGDDTIYLLSASPYCSTAIMGGKGSDNIFIGYSNPADDPDKLLEVVASTPGQSGVVLHKFDADSYDPNSANNKVAVSRSLATIDGFFAYVIDGDRPVVKLAMERDDERMGHTVMFENDLFVSNVAPELKSICYTLRLSQDLTNHPDGAEVTIDVPQTEKSDPIMNARMWKTRTRAGKWGPKEGIHVDLKKDTITVSHYNDTRVCLEPNPATFYDMDTDLSNHGERYLSISHQVSKFNGTENQDIEMPGMFFVRLLISHETGVHMLAPTRSLDVIEGSHNVGKSDSYEMVLVGPDMKGHTQDVLERRVQYTWLDSTKTGYQFSPMSVIPANFLPRVLTTTTTSTTTREYSFNKSYCAG